MKTVLLLAHDDPGQTARLQCALDLTRAIQGHLHCLDVTRFPVFGRDYVTTIGDMNAFLDEQDRESANSARLKGSLAQEGVSWTFSEVTGDPADQLVDQAALADVIVVSTRLESSTHLDMVSIASEAALRSRSLVLAVPPSVGRLALDRPALIAWDGSPPAVAALRAAVPLLTQLPSIILFAVDEDRSGPTAAEAAIYLSRHGITAEFVTRKSDGVMTPDILIRSVCSSQDIGLCVMGAYGHSKMLEGLFGGVTRRMLARTECPLLLAH